MQTIPKAFLSHSSKDKHIVSAIANELGPLRCEIDEYSFEFILNTAAIRRAMSRSLLFVLILSQNSVQSNFVAEELRAALESRARGELRDVLIFAIDQTSYRELPEWLRELNVAQHLKTAKQIARRIDAKLVALDLDKQKLRDFYLPREDQEEELRKYLAQSRRSVPTVLHVVGHYGSGRRTFLRNTLNSLAPRQYEFQLELSVSEFDGPQELFRKLYELLESANPLVAGERFAAFSALPVAQQYEELASQIKRLANEGCSLFVLDEGGIYQGGGDYQEYLASVLQHLSGFGRPAIFVLQTRMMREIHKPKYPWAAHIRMPSLSDTKTEQLMSLILNELKVDYTKPEITEVCKFSGGHPFNVHFIAAYIASEGLDVALSDPSEILQQSYERGLDFIRRISLTTDQLDVVALLADYRFCDLEFIATALDKSGVELVEAVRNLEDYCIIERRDRILTIAPPLRDAIRRDARFRRSPAWQTEVGGRVIETLAGFEAEESVPLSLIDSAIPEMIRQGRELPLLTTLILPSHLLRVARTNYDKRRWSDAVDFSRKALELESQLSIDARIEANRLLGLALTRLDPDQSGILDVVSVLRRYATDTANRVAFFIEGFRARRRGEYDSAEDCYRKAASIEPGNYHINRELSFVLCKMSRYSEGEPFARTIYRRASDNPYILDVLIEAIEGKASQGMAIDRSELQELYRALEDVCNSGGTQFFNIRRAKRDQDLIRSFDQIGKAIVDAKGEDKVEAIYFRAEMCIRASDFGGARKDIATLAALDRESRRRADALEVRCLIAEEQFAEAKNVLDTRFGRARRMAATLEKQLARAIAFKPDGQARWLIEWAKRVG